jgi:hypothetical protein
MQFSDLDASDVGQSDGDDAATFISAAAEIANPVLADDFSLLNEVLVCQKDNTACLPSRRRTVGRRGPRHRQERHVEPRCPDELC